MYNKNFLFLKIMMDPMSPIAQKMKKRSIKANKCNQKW